MSEPESPERPPNRFGAAWSRVRACLPERQIYIRSEGRVQFFTLSPALQGCCAALVLVFLAWAAFSSVTVIFKDRIIAAEDHRMQRMQEAHDDQVGELQLAYDELVGRAATVQAEADRQVATLDARQQRLGRAAGDVYPTTSGMALSQPPARNTQRIRAPDGFVGRALDWLQSRRPKANNSGFQPGIAALARDVARLKEMTGATTGLMDTIRNGVAGQAQARRSLIASTGIDPQALMRRLAQEQGVGGPEVSLEGIQLDGISDRQFSRSYMEAEAELGEIGNLRQALARLPTAKPVGDAIGRTSGFGPRIDPFSGRYAFHPGVDFAGPAGTAVLATASGTVRFAGRDGGYGNMVEIQHGFGLRTRYAHLLSTSVVEGQHVARGTVVGRMGSTGRSTGPHVHYEVWFDNVVHNPDGFLRLGRSREANLVP